MQINPISLSCSLLWFFLGSVPIFAATFYHVFSFISRVTSPPPRSFLLIYNPFFLPKMQPIYHPFDWVFSFATGAATRAAVGSFVLASIFLVLPLRRCYHCYLSGILSAFFIKEWSVALSLSLATVQIRSSLLDVYQLRRWSCTPSPLREILGDASDSICVDFFSGFEAYSAINAVFEAMGLSCSSILAKNLISCWFEQFHKLMVCPPE